MSELESRKKRWCQIQPSVLTLGLGISVGFPAVRRNLYQHRTLISQSSTEEKRDVQHIDITSDGLARMLIALYKHHQ